jgi:LacI family transcriptional regulator
MATIKDVARRAGVSVGTVSNVLSGLPTVTKELRERVETTMRELRYQPSHVARSLKLKNTHTLAMVISDITNPFFPMIVRGAEDAAAEHGYMLSIFNTDDDIERERQGCGILSSRRVDGLLLVPALLRGDDSHIESLMQSGTPVVCMDRLPDGLDVDAVLVDNAAGVADCIRHLVSQGARRIAYLGGERKLYISSERLEGFKRGMLGAGIPIDPSLVWEGDFRQESGFRIGKEALGHLQFDAVFVANIPMVLGFLRAMAEAGVEAPRDILLATFDHLEILNSFRPRLTSVAQPGYQIGQNAVKLLLDRIANPNRASRVERLSTELKIADSSMARAN